MEKTATFVKDLDGWTGRAKLYALSEYIEFGDGNDKTGFVAVSAAVAYGSGPETYIFPTDENGKVLDWGELPGSFQGDLDHDEALFGMGFSPVYA